MYNRLIVFFLHFKKTEESVKNKESEPEVPVSEAAANYRKLKQVN
jgi:hypothetical protein